MSGTTDLVAPYAQGWEDLDDEDKLQALSERKLGKNQIALGLFLLAEGAVSDHAQTVTVLEGIREFNAQKRGNSDGKKRVPVAQQIVQSLEVLRDREEAGDPATYHQGVADSISVAGRFIK